jgi:hypothetical protein
LESAATIVSNPRGQSDVAKHRKLTKQAQRRSRQAIYDQIRTLRDAGTSIRDIAKETGFCTRSVRKWLKFNAPPEHRANAVLAKLFPYLSFPAAGRKGAFGIANCSMKLNCAATPAVFPIWSGS